jgi:bifunctional non-homologous end joining protein LigD
VREDKPAGEVVREYPVAIATKSARQGNKVGSKIAAEASKTVVKKSKRPAASTTRRSAKRAASAKPSRAKSSASTSSTAKSSASKSSASKPWKEGDVRFTHPDRVYWVDVGITKQDLADYYREVWDWMAPHVVGRPLSLVRCPEGTKGQCFFQKHASAGLAERNLRTVTDSNKRQIIAVESLEGLLSLVQAGVLEVHVRGSMIDRLDRCDRIVFDLDPGEGTGWPDVLAAAQDVRERLAAIDLESFVKLSGGKGLHVVLPIEPADWDTTKTFVQAFAQAMAADDPERYVATMAKVARKGKIFVDYLRNSLEQTSVAAFSTRAREGAPVSAPVSWRELGRTTGGNQYTILNLMKRLRGLKQDPWKDIGHVRQKLPDLQSLRERG